MTPTPTPLIEAAEIHKTFRARGGLLGWLGRRGPAAAASVPAVDAVSVTVSPGDRIGIVGESGGGKTTLGRLLAGLIRPDAGVVRWRGQDVAQLSPAQRHRLRRHHVQFLFQNQYASLNPRLTALQCVVESVRCHRGLRGPTARVELRQTSHPGLPVRIHRQVYSQRTFPDFYIVNLKCCLIPPKTQALTRVSQGCPHLV